MDTQTLWLVIRAAISFVALGTMIAFMMQRNLRQYRERNKWNWARFLMIMSFAFSFFMHALSLGFYGLEIQGFENLIGTGIQEFTLNSIFMGGTIMFSATFAAYIYEFDAFLLFPGFLYVGAIVMSILIPEINFVMMYIMTFGCVSIIALFWVGIKLRDNMSLGIGIMSVLQLVASFFELYAQTALSLASVIFAAITIVGLFRPFGKQEV